MVRISRTQSEYQHVEVKPHYPLVTRIIIDLFLSGELPNVREIDIEPQYGCASRIVYHNGSVRMFRSPCLDINKLGASEIAKDKGYTKYFLSSLGYNTPRGKVFLLREYRQWLDKSLSRYNFTDYAAVEGIYDYISSSIGYPCFIKPNDGSQGKGVQKCFDKEDVESAIAEYQRNAVTMLIVEETVDWPDYRVVVLKDQIISCYLRKPLQVVGDGIATIKMLLLQKQASFTKDGRGMVININDPRIAKRLMRSGYSLETILNLSQVCRIYDVSNLSLGGESEDYTDRICKHWRDLCVKLTADMGLMFCGVDIVCTDLESAEASYSIFEINAAPGLTNYGASGEKQAAIVRELYRKVFYDPLC